MKVVEQVDNLVRCSIFAEKILNKFQIIIRRFFSDQFPSTGIRMVVLCVVFNLGHADNDDNWLAEWSSR